MIELHPNLENIYSCPVCDGPVDVRDFIISGMRNLVDITCPTCRRSFYADIPAGHGLMYPFAIDQEISEIIQPENPFGRVLRIGCEEKRPEEVELKIIRRTEGEEILVLNCLDYIYGHCLLKLLNAQYYLDRYPALACCVLVPRQLTHLVPEGAAEIWESSIPLREYRYWWVSLEQKISAEIKKRKKAYLALGYPQPHHSAFSLSRFEKTGRVKGPSLGTPAIVFCYRTDRLWGSTVRQQRRNITKLHRLLRNAYPQMTFALIGPGDRLKFRPEILDKRVEGFQPEMEKAWLELLHDTDCAVGVFGSNMLLPTGLAECAVELLPEQLYPNILQDYLLRDDYTDPYENLFRLRVLYGNEQLTDISPRRVAQVVVTQLAEWERFRDLLRVFQRPQNGQPESDPMRTVELLSKYRNLKPPTLTANGRSDRYLTLLRRGVRKAWVLSLGRF